MKTTLSFMMRLVYLTNSLVVLSSAILQDNNAEIHSSDFGIRDVNSYGQTSSISSQTVSSPASENQENTELEGYSVRLGDSNELNGKEPLYPPHFLDEDSPDGLEWWPWHHDDDGNDQNDDAANRPDSSDDNSNDSGSDDISPPIENTCASHTDCTNCYASSSVCHWCAFDNQCHSKGSWYGCAFGANCNADNYDNDDNMHNNTSSDDDVIPPDNSHGKQKKDNSCRSHSTCSECSLSSHFCHWCEKDNACHAIGSWYGCAHGANCYSNHRCRRIEPEVMEPWSWWKMARQMGVVPLALGGILSFVVICCSSVLFTGVKALEGVYEELEFVERRDSRVEPFSIITCDEHSNSNENQGTRSAVSERESCTNFELHESHSLLSDQNGESHRIADEENDSEAFIVSTPSPNGPCNSEHSITPHPSISRLPTRNSRRSSNHIKCLMRTCSMWYISTLFSVFLLSTGYIYFFPKTPLYNVCSDEIAWRSIIDGITSLKMKASFEILMSIQNPNHLDITLESLGGTFRHDGQDVGSFNVPKAIIKRTSITDVLVTCSVVPDRWEALGLISDYYKGQLFFSVSANGNVDVSGIGYSIPVQISDYLVRVNDPDMADRHLCACPQWRDFVPSSSPIPIDDFLPKKSQ